MGLWLATDPALGEYVAATGGAQDLGVFAPMHLSSFADGALCPLVFLDPDGREIRSHRDQVEVAGETRIHYQLSFTGRLLNDSSRPLTAQQLQDVRDRIGQQVKQSHTGEDVQVDDNGHIARTTWTMNADIDIEGQANTLLGRRHLIRLTDRICGRV